MPDTKSIANLQEMRKEALKTMRKLHLFGFTNNNKLALDSEWPKEQDMMTMPGDKPIEAVGFNWHKF